MCLYITHTERMPNTQQIYRDYTCLFSASSIIVNSLDFVFNSSGTYFSVVMLFIED